MHKSGGNFRGGGKGTKSSGPPFTSSGMEDAATDAIPVGQATHAIVMRIAGGLPKLRVKSPAAPLSGGDDRSRRE